MSKQQTKIEKYVSDLRDRLSEYKKKNKLTYVDLHDHIYSDLKKKISPVTLNRFLQGHEPSIQSMITYERFLK